MKTDDAIPPFDLIVSLDRSDKSAAVAILDMADPHRLQQSETSTAPDALESWWHSLHQTHPKARIAVAFEQPAPNLVAFFASRNPAVIYALNPAATYSYRNALTVSHARNDPSDARTQAQFVAHAWAQLRPWQAPREAITQLERLTLNRRKLVNQRTGLTNRLQATLKRYYPQALEVMHEHVWRPMNLAFLRRWPQPKKLQRARRQSLRDFFHRHGSRSQTCWETRLKVIENLVVLGAVNPADELEVAVMLDQIEVLNEGIKSHEKAIAEVLKSEGEKADRIAALPGAGPIYTPRLHVALEKYAPNCESPEDLAAAVGIAPVTDQSGKMRKVHRRLRCDTFIRQSFVEWAKESWKHSVWAETFYRQREARGDRFNTIMRALAYKWIRILWRCWQDGVVYDEIKYLKALRAKGSPLVPAGIDL